MSQTPPVSTLVEYPFYKGHDPRKWKYINAWDSKTHQKDIYINEKFNIPQCDIVCGKGIIAVDYIQQFIIHTYSAIDNLDDVTFMGSITTWSNDIHNEFLSNHIDVLNEKELAQNPCIKSSVGNPLLFAYVYSASTFEPQTSIKNMSNLKIRYKVRESEICKKKITIPISTLKAVGVKTVFVVGLYTEQFIEDNINYDFLNPV